ncbi:uncharacterized protein G2W53_041165 [Senna tora]|uniref:Uncharacterized protein n=1 Tax=Senna tora TaxID=362788 RepID=A0A834W2N1_9FABA|nr:uncharacterized protein G2W53_041165 [Senna tora]
MAPNLPEGGGAAILMCSTSRLSSRICTISSNRRASEHTGASDGPAMTVEAVLD